MCKGTRRRRAGPKYRVCAGVWRKVRYYRGQAFGRQSRACAVSGQLSLPAAQQPRASRAKKRRHRCKLEKERASHYAAAPIKTENSALLGVSPRPCQEGAGSEKPQLHFFPYSSGMSFRGAFSLSQQNHLFSSFLPLPLPLPVCFLPFISHSPSFGLPHT